MMRADREFLAAEIKASINELADSANYPDLLEAVDRLAHIQPDPVAVPDGWKLVPDNEKADEIVTALYRRFKEWSKRGFGPDDVTWCEVRAEVLALVVSQSAESESQENLPLTSETQAVTVTDEDAEIERRFNDMGDNEGQGLHPYFKDAYRQGWHARAKLAAAPQPVCQTCNGHGMIGGPSYYHPDEGGEPCPDCSAKQPDAQQPAQALTDFDIVTMANHIIDYSFICDGAGPTELASDEARQAGLIEFARAIEARLKGDD